MPNPCVGRAAALSAKWVPDNGNGTYTNPLFFDEFSDPDLIRVGSDFYLTGTTMHSMPVLPVLHSRDLVKWTVLSYALDKLDLGPSFRLEDGTNEYGPASGRLVSGTTRARSISSATVSGQTTQLFRATDPKGLWTRTPPDETIAARSVHALR